MPRSKGSSLKAAHGKCERLRRPEQYHSVINTPRRIPTELGSPLVSDSQMTARSPLTRYQKHNVGHKKANEHTPVFGKQQGMYMVNQGVQNNFKKKVTGNQTPCMLFCRAWFTLALSLWTLFEVGDVGRSLHGALAGAVNTATAQP